MLSPPVAFAFLGEVAVIPIPVPQMKIAVWQPNGRRIGSLLKLFRARATRSRDYLKEVRRI